MWGLLSFQFIESQFNNSCIILTWPSSQFTPIFSQMPTQKLKSAQRKDT